MTRVDPEHILLAFHLKDCFPQATPRAIADTVSALVSLSAVIYRYARIKAIERPLRDYEIKTHDEAVTAAEQIAATFGFKIEVSDFMSGGGLGVYLPNRYANNLGGETWDVKV